MEATIPALPHSVSMEAKILQSAHCRAGGRLFRSVETKQNVCLLIFKAILKSNRLNK